MKLTRNPAANSAPLTVVSDGAMGTENQVQGRVIPVILVDCTDREDLRDMVSLHKSLNRLGDVEHQWAVRRIRPRSVFLMLKFLDPIKTDALIEFQLPAQALLIEWIIVVGSPARSPVFV